MVPNCNSVLFSHLWGSNRMEPFFLLATALVPLKSFQHFLFLSPSSFKGTILLLPLSSILSCPWQFVKGPAQPFVVFLGSSPSIPAAENRTQGLEAFGGCIFDVQDDPCWLQAHRNLGVVDRDGSCPYREIHRGKGMGILLPDPLGSVWEPWGQSCWGHFLGPHRCHTGSKQLFQM